MTGAYRCLCSKSIKPGFTRITRLTIHIRTFSTGTTTHTSFQAKATVTVEPPALHQDTYYWHEETENLEAYTRGGYHPVHIGDKFNNGRYKIVHKLGFGSYSTVWLAQDSQNSRFVALKIIVADASTTNSESSILSRLASGARDHPGSANLPTLVDEFYIEGPNGRHRCVVSDAVGCSIAQSKECSTTWLFPANVARSIAAQVLQALAYVHSCGVVHGDLHSNNILFKSPRFAASSTDRLYEDISVPQRLPVKRVDNLPIGPEAPEYCVPSAIVVQSAEEVSNPEIIIADFGEAFVCEGGSPSDVKLRTPILLLPLEVIFGEDLGQAIDVWTAASAIYEILGERPLFEGFMPDEDHVVAEMISTLGMIPESWWESWSARRDYFLEDRSWKQDTTRIHAPYSRPLSERLRIMGRGFGGEGDEFDSQELALLERLLKAMMAYEPAQRLTSKAALSEAWMKEYGLPAISKGSKGT